jgi:hypothetical protein
MAKIRGFILPVTRHPVHTDVYLAPLKAIITTLCATVLQKHAPGNLAVKGLSFWCATCIFRSHILKYTTELTNAELMS